MLYKNMMEPCILMEKTRVPDGAGGFVTTWSDGAPFDAAIVMDTTVQARIAEGEGFTAVYTITTDRGVGLEFHDIFKRAADGQIFRVTSNSGDRRSPTFSGIVLEQVNAERWELS